MDIIEYAKLKKMSGGGGSGGENTDTLKALLDATKSAYYLFRDYTGTSVDGLIPYNATENVENMQYMFYACRKLTTIPLFETGSMVNCSNMFAECSSLKTISTVFNFKEGEQVDISRMFSNCLELLSPPQMTKCKANSFDRLFENCRNIKFPSDFASDWDFSIVRENLSLERFLYGCYSIRKIPQAFMNGIKRWGSNNFTSLYTVDEIVGVAVSEYEETYNRFTNWFNSNCRMQRFTFKTNSGQPIVAKWKTQTIYMTGDVGYARNFNFDYNHGITADKEVKDDATYQALKNDPDWFTNKIEYSRYNKTSAIETINSLPDTSAYLASAGGTNTINFKGNAGSLTDGGAINTMTEEEIAVATAKGWTVTFS